MECRDVRQLLPRFQDERLAQDDQALVQGHLDGCGTCLAELRAEQRTDGLLSAALADHPFGDAAVERLLQELPRLARPRRQVRRPGLGLGAAAAAVLLAGGLLVLPGRGPQGEPELATVGPGAVLATGTGLLRRTAEGGFEALPAQAGLRAGEHLVAAETPAAITFEDGTRVDLHSDTELTLRPDADGGLTLAFGAAGGEVLCDVARRRTPFRVAARNLEVEVLGTRFLVHQGARVSRAVVQRGAVLVTAHGQRRRLGPDDAAEARAEVQSLELLRVTALQHGLWVPRIAEEARLQAAQQSSTPAPAGEPAPAGSATPAAPPAPVDPSLDVPVVPPSEDAKPQGLPGQGR